MILWHSSHPLPGVKKESISNLAYRLLFFPHKTQSSFFSIGIPSMCVIFSVLCLVILALLTLGTSRQDLQTSRLSLDQTTAYYTACSTATQQYSQISDFITSALTDSSEKKDYLSRMSSIQEEFPDLANLTWTEDTQVLSFTVAFTDTQAVDFRL